MLNISGDLERLRRYWMTGTCKPGREVQKSSDPLALEQFLSAFLLLMMGILLAAAFLLLEHLYFKYVRQHLARSDGGGCCALFSLVSCFLSRLVYLTFGVSIATPDESLRVSHRGEIFISDVCIFWKSNCLCKKRGCKRWSAPKRVFRLRPRLWSCYRAWGSPWRSVERFTRPRTSWGTTDAGILSATHTCGRSSTSWTWPGLGYGSWKRTSKLTG